MSNSSTLRQGFDWVQSMAQDSARSRRTPRVSSQEGNRWPPVSVEVDDQGQPWATVAITYEAVEVVHLLLALLEMVTGEPPITRPHADDPLAFHLCLTPAVARALGEAQALITLLRAESAKKAS